MKKTYDLTVGNPARLILDFYFPMLFTNLLQQVYNVVDTAIVGKGLGDNALGAVGNMSSIMFFTFGFSMGLTNGFAVIIGQYFGAGDKKNLRKTIAASATLSAILAVLLTLISSIALRPLLVAMQTDPLILDDSLKYGHILLGCIAVTISYNLVSGVLRALGDSRTPLMAIIVATVINIVFDWIAINKWGMGVEGPAYVTVIAQIVSTLICLVRFRKIEEAIPKRADFRPDMIMFSKLLGNGVPMALMNSITAVGCMIVQYFVNGMGLVYTSAYSACSKYLNIFMMPSSTAGNTLSTYTSQNYGAKKYIRIKQGLQICLTIALISYVLLGSVMVFGSEQLAGFMLTGSEQIKLASGFLIRCGIMIFAVDFLFIVRNAVQGMGKPFIPMLSGILEMVLRIGTIMIFTAGAGFAAASYAEIAAWTGALLMNIYAFVRVYRPLIADSGYRLNGTVAPAK